MHNSNTKLTKIPQTKHVFTYPLNTNGQRPDNSLTCYPRSPPSVIFTEFVVVLFYYSLLLSLYYFITIYSLYYKFLLCSYMIFSTSIIIRINYCFIICTNYNINEHTGLQLNILFMNIK
jgi:hypothetical protein